MEERVCYDRNAGRALLLKKLWMLVPLRGESSVGAEKRVKNSVYLPGGFP